MGFFVCYLVAAELISSKKSKGEILVFRRGHIPASAKGKYKDDVEIANEHEANLEKMETDASAVIQEQTAIFHWKDVCFDIKIKGQPRRILDHVDGWVRPGTLTCLMVS